MNKKTLKKLVGVAVSVSVLAVVYTNIELAGFARLFADIDFLWLVASILLFVPLFLLRATTFRRMIAPELPLGTTLRVILAANALNVLLPSKGGELVKGFFVRKFVDVPISRCIGAVALERWLDIEAIAILGSAGYLLMPGADTFAGRVAFAVSLAIHAGSLSALIGFLFIPERWYTKPLARFPKMATFVGDVRAFVAGALRDGLAYRIGAVVIVIWLLTLAQYACFFAALHYTGPWLAVPAFVPAAILAGILPLTMAGIGTRDAALLVLFAGFTTPELATGVGLLSHLRYILPGIVGGFVVRRMF